MDLLEYQAKELFREIGIPVLPSQRIDRPSDLKGLKIPYPVVLKSQVLTGGRGRAGGIKFVENTIDAIAAAQTIFHLPIMGEYPKVLLAEARYDTQQEFYLAVTLDYTLRRPVLLGSPQGGIDVEAVMEQMQQVVVEEKFSPFYARRLALKMGLQGALIQSVSAILEKMYQLFIQQDLDLVEINPLGVSPTGEVMALDGKVTANDNALGRHPDLMVLASNRESSEEKQKTCHPLLLTPGFAEPDGNIAVVCNGMGLAMATLDLLYQSGGKPANCLNIGEETCGDTAASLLSRLERGLELIAQENGIKVILINMVGSVASSHEIGGSLVQYLQRIIGELPVPRLSNSRQRQTRSDLRQPHQYVIRLASWELETLRERLSLPGVYLVDKLDDAVAQAVALAKSASKRQ